MYVFGLDGLTLKGAGSFSHYMLYIDVSNIDLNDDNLKILVPRGLLLQAAFISTGYTGSTTLLREYYI